MQNLCSFSVFRCFLAKNRVSSSSSLFFLCSRASPTPPKNGVSSADEESMDVSAAPFSSPCSSSSSSSSLRLVLLSSVIQPLCVVSSLALASIIFLSFFPFLLVLSLASLTLSVVFFFSPSTSCFLLFFLSFLLAAAVSHAPVARFQSRSFSPLPPPFFSLLSSPDHLSLCFIFTLCCSVVSA